MRISFPLFFAILCFVRAQPIKEKGELELVDDAAVIADPTKGEMISNHKFLTKQVDTLKEGIIQNQDQQLKSALNTDNEINEFGTMMLDAEPVRQEFNKKSFIEDLKSPKAERVQEKTKEEVSSFSEKFISGIFFAAGKVTYKI